MAETAAETTTITVAVADDERFVRRALTGYLATEADIEVIGEAGDGAQAVDLVRDLGPDVLLLDLQMPEMDGLEATKRIVASGSDTKILIVTGHVDDTYLAPVLLAGAGGYVVKDSEPEAIVAAVRDVCAGGCPVDPAVTRHLVEAVRAGGGEGDATSDAVAGDREGETDDVDLTPREVEVLDLLCEGRNTREIAGELYLSEPTVKYYLSGLMQKFTVRDRVQLVIAALRRRSG